jgi:hypothetical protein
MAARIVAMSARAGDGGYRPPLAIWMIMVAVLIAEPASPRAPITAALTQAVDLKPGTPGRSD